MGNNLILNEVVYDHYKTYITVCSEQDYKRTDLDYIISDTAVGNNCDENYIIDTGMVNDRVDKLFVNFCSLHSEDPVAASRCHAVYTRCTLESLHEIEKMLQFPFCDSIESRKIVSGELSIDDPGRIKTIETAINSQWDKIKIDNEFLKAVACYVYKRKTLKAKKYLYIIVPDSESDYSAYCLKVIREILYALPVGMRKGLRIATNAIKEDNYNVLFVRKKNLNSETIGLSVDLSQPNIPEFISNHKLDNILTKLIEDCVESPQDSGEGNMVDICYEELELSIIKDVRNVTEKHYKDQIEILELQKKEITQESVKEFSDKLGENLAKEQREALEKQIRRSFPNTSRLERVLKSAQDEQDVRNFKEYFAFLADYKNLILELKKNGVFLSQEYFDNRVTLIYEFFFMSTKDDESVKGAEDQLHTWQAWEKELKDHHDSIKDYFREEYYEPEATDAQTNIAKWEDELYKRFYAECNGRIKDDFTVDNIRKVLNQFTDRYPSPDKKLEFCREVIEEVASYRNPDTNVTDYIHLIRKTCKEVEIPSVLYPEYEKETIEAVLAKPSARMIRDSAGEVREYFGDEGERQFRAGLSASFETQLGNKQWTKEKLDAKSYDEVFAIGDELNAHSQSERMYLKTRIVNTFGKLIGQSTYDKNAIEDQIAAVSKYLGTDAILCNSTKKEITNITFGKMKEMAELDYADSAEEARDKKEKIDYLYGILNINKLMTKEIHEWYLEWKDRGKIVIRRKELEEEVDTLTEYLYVCRKEPRAVDFDLRKKLRKNIVNSAKNTPEIESYSVNAFLTAISYTEQIPAGSILKGDASDKRIKFYRTQFSEFQKLELLPIVLYEGMSLETVYSYIQCLEMLSNNTKDVIFVFKKNEEIKKTAADIQQVKNGLDSFIRLCLGKAAEAEETEKKIINDSAFFQKGDQLWLFFREAGVLDDYYLDALRKSPTASADRLKRFLNHIDKLDSSVKKAKLKKKILMGLGVFAIALIMFAAGFGLKGLFGQKDEKSTIGLTESEQGSTAGMSAESSTSDSAKGATNLTPAAETGSTQQNGSTQAGQTTDESGAKKEGTDSAAESGSTQKAEQDNAGAEKSAVEPEIKEETETGNADTGSADEPEDSEDTNSEGQTENGTENEEEDEEENDENQEGVQGRIKKADQPVAVYKSRKKDSKPILQALTAIDVTILDVDFGNKGNDEKIKIRFNTKYTDKDGNQVEKGQTGYVLKRFLQTEAAWTN